MKDKILIACSKNWFVKNKFVKIFLKKNKSKFIIISKKKDLNLSNLNKINPKIIFFPNWSHIVSEKIIIKYNCICFHTSPLPYGRGGSPIQNLILKKFKKSPVCAIRMTKKIDSGPIYLKRNISLLGNLDEIFDRISLKIVEMIKILLKKKINPKKQKGKIFIFKRIKENQSEIKKNDNLNFIYDKIRMLSSENYPHAFIKNRNLKIYLTRPIIKKKQIFCEAKVEKIEKKY